MCPTIVLKDDKPYLLIGASGGPLIITATLQTIINTLVFRLDVARAVASQITSRIACRAEANIDRFIELFDESDFERAADGRIDVIQFLTERAFTR